MAERAQGLQRCLNFGRRGHLLIFIASAILVLFGCLWMKVQA